MSLRPPPTQARFITWHELAWPIDQDVCATTVLWPQKRAFRRRDAEMRRRRVWRVWAHPLSTCQSSNRSRVDFRRLKSALFFPALHCSGKISARATAERRRRLSPVRGLPTLMHLGWPITAQSIQAKRRTATDEQPQTNRTCPVPVARARTEACRVCRSAHAWQWGSYRQARARTGNRQVNVPSDKSRRGAFILSRRPERDGAKKSGKRA